MRTDAAVFVEVSSRVALVVWEDAKYRAGGTLTRERTVVCTEIPRSDTNMAKTARERWRSEGG